MKNNKAFMETIVTFASLWGATMCYNKMSQKSIDNMIAREMERYESNELVTMFIEWTEEYKKNEKDEDIVDFFDEKIKSIVNNETINWG